ncbi:hypothetical protein GS966_19940 [Rhodococcus hoagii]|nr:hypothetical protein [Prescottella equi]NKS73150.1 hypothetical protein [Prescottella equi]NKZ92198.1 hypothetical protein [Prescottella equi]
MKNLFVWIGAFLVIAFLLTYWKVIVSVALLAAVIYGAYLAASAWTHRRRERLNGERARRSALSARAEAQHQQYLAGEDRGLYGEFKPAPLD